MVDAPIVVVLKAHVEEDDEGRHAPAYHDVLLGGQHSVLLNDARHQSVEVDPLQEHEGEADSEEVMNGDGDDLALSDWPVPYYQIVSMLDCSCNGIPLQGNFNYV